MQKTQLLHQTGLKEKAKAIQKPKILGQAAARLWRCKCQGSDCGSRTSSAWRKQNGKNVYRRLVRGLGCKGSASEWIFKQANKHTFRWWFFVNWCIHYSRSSMCTTTKQATSFRAWKLLRLPKKRACAINKHQGDSLPWKNCVFQNLQNFRYQGRKVFSRSLFSVQWKDNHLFISSKQAKYSNWEIKLGAMESYF